MGPQLGLIPRLSLLSVTGLRGGMALGIPSSLGHTDVAFVNKRWSHWTSVGGLALRVMSCSFKDLDVWRG